MKRPSSRTRSSNLCQVWWMNSESRRTRRLCRRPTLFHRLPKFHRRRRLLRRWSTPTRFRCKGETIMEKMPYSETSVLETHIMPEMRTTEVASSDWRQQLPVLAGQQVRLRELRVTDAPSLFAMLTTEEVSRFISPPPTTVEAF